MAVLVLASAVVLAWGWLLYRLTQRHAWLRRSAPAVLLSGLGLRLVLDLRPDWESWLLPSAGYATVQGLGLYLLAVSFFGACASSLPLRWNRLVLAGLALATTWHGATRHRSLAMPEIHGDERLPRADRHLRQSTIYTCGPAACATALAYGDRWHSERELAAVCQLQAGGARLFQLYAGIRALAPGWRVAIEAVDLAAAVPGPLVLVASNDSRGHAVCVWIDGDEAVLHDPLREAPERLARNQLAGRIVQPVVVLRR